ncbi:uncharacterized protein C20orf96 homolog [Trichomycterus rosablanca]|uniref:uncharacterized protein C20orf96 homolog n=1 Tax=Trichomycterus rosablanca TaxID=2290929 RepID=UPI002F351939
MNKLPKLIYCPRYSDRRMLELSRTDVLKPPKPKPVFWASAPPDRKTFKPAHRTVGREENVPTSRANIEQGQLGKSEKSQDSNNHRSSASTARLPRRTKDYKKDLESAFTLINTMRKDDLEKYCRLLEERNHQLAKDIKDADRRSFYRERELLSQSEKQNLIISRVHWIDRQAKAELKETIVEAEKRLSGLQTQLGVAKASVQNAQSELHKLKNSKACLALRITKLQEELTTLEQQQQDVHKELERRVNLKQQKMLSDIAKENLSLIPPAVKHLALNNQIVRTEIHKHKQEIMELEEKNRHLRKSIRELQQTKTNLRRNVLQSFLKRDKCTPDMSVHLTIPREDFPLI